MKLFKVIFLVLISMSEAFAQFDPVWVWGLHGGYDFNSNSFFTSGIERQSTRTFHSTNHCSCDGRLLFYGDNFTIWNGQDSIIKDGIYDDYWNNEAQGLTQAVIILPRPDSINQYYYIVSRDSMSDPSNYRIFYSVIDATIDAGKGGIVPGKKNIVLAQNKQTEYFTVARHANGKDYWLLAQVSRSTIYSFLVTGTGISTTPVINSALGDNRWGRIRFSHNETMLATTGVPSSVSSKSVHLYSFDKSTGQLSFIKSLLDQAAHPFHATSALEFSPNDSILYVGTGESFNQFSSYNSKIFQIHLYKNLTPNVIHTFPDVFRWIDLKMGPDYKIYANGSFDMDSDIYVIKQPDIYGIGCKFNYWRKAPFIKGITLPNNYYPFYKIEFTGNFSANTCTDTTSFVYSGDTRWKQIRFYFGDGDSMTFDSGQIPNKMLLKHRYAQSGQYPVEARFYYPGCNSYNWWTDTITIKLNPIIHVSKIDSVRNCLDQKFTLKDSSSNYSNWQINWGDGVSDIRSSNGILNHSFTGDSLHNILITASNSTCTTSLLLKTPIKFLAKPEIKAAILDTFLCIETMLEVIDTTGPDIVKRRILWGDGQISEYNAMVSQPFSYKLSIAGNSIPLIITDTNSLGCHASDTLYYRAIPHAKASFIFDSTVLCEKSVIGFTDLSSSSDSIRIHWGDLSFESLKGNQGGKASHTYSIPVGNNNFKLVYIAENAACSDTFVKDLVIFQKPFPKAQFTLDKNKTCEGNSVQLNNTSQFADSNIFVSWPGGNATGKGLTSVTMSSLPVGNQQVQLIATNTSGCNDTATDIVYVVKIPVAKFTLNKYNGCFPLSVQLANQSSNADSLVVDWGDGSAQTFEKGSTASLNHIFKAKGDFEVTIKAYTGNCAHYSTDSVHTRGYTGKEPLQVINATVHDDNTTIEVNWKKEPEAFAYRLYRKENQSPFNLIGEFNSTQYLDKAVNPLKSTYTYVIKGIDSCGNESDTSNFARSILLKGNVLGLNESAELNWNAYLSWQNGVDFYRIEKSSASSTWTLLTNVTDLNTSDPAFILDGANLICYRVTAVEMAGNQSLSQSNVLCLPLEPVLYIPNTFTPNDDQRNDFFRIYGLGISELTIVIYNRWGEAVYKGNDLSKGWDGLYNGKEAPEGIYSYVLNARSTSGATINKTGSLHLIR